MNLVGSTAPEEIELHIRDSLAAAAQLPAGCALVDLGSGAGFPGIPIALARPDVRVTLVETRERRVSFLRFLNLEMPAASSNNVLLELSRSLRISSTIPNSMIE